MSFLKSIQGHLEDRYGAATGLNVEDFLRLHPGLPGLGELLVETQTEGPEVHLNLALLLDRDIHTAWQSTQNLREIEISVPFEEVSHFVYLCWNHARGRNVTKLEMEIQAEVDRILLAYHGNLGVSAAQAKTLLESLLEKPYDHAKYEESRQTAAGFVRSLPDPARWGASEFRRLRAFFHNDLGGKINLSQKSGL
jgi:hypothetical protein